MKPIIPSTFVTAETRGVAFISTLENIGKVIESIPLQNYSDVLISLKSDDSSATLAVYSKSRVDEITELVSALGLSDMRFILLIHFYA